MISIMQIHIGYTISLNRKNLLFDFDVLEIEDKNRSIDRINEL